MPRPGSMILRFLGAGGAFSRHYGTTCSVLTLQGGARWLIDCGRQAPDQLEAAGISWHEIEGQIITHVHGDHIYGLEDFAFSRFYSSQNGVAAIRQGGPKPKLMAHTAVLAELWTALQPALGYVPDGGGGSVTGSMGDYFETLEPVATKPPRLDRWPSSETFAADGLPLITRECRHVPGKPSTSLEIGLPGDKIAWWSGDSVVDTKRLIELEPKATIFFHDCTFVEYEGQVHGAFSLLENLPDAVRHKMVLMHHEDDIESNRARAEARGFRIALPGHRYDLATGRQIVSV